MLLGKKKSPIPVGIGDFSESEQAPNPDSKVRPSLKNPETQFFGLGWHNNHKTTIDTGSYTIDTGSYTIDTGFSIYLVDIYDYWLSKKNLSKQKCWV